LVEDLGAGADADEADDFGKDAKLPGKETAAGGGEAGFGVDGVEVRGRDGDDVCAIERHEFGEVVDEVAEFYGAGRGWSGAPVWGEDVRFHHFRYVIEWV